MAKSGGGSHVPTIKDILQDNITKIASENWALGVSSKVKYNESIVKDIYKTEIQRKQISRLQLLEFSGYLEHYLWNHFTPDVCFEHVFSIIMMVNEKFREGTTGLEMVTGDNAKFQSFFQRVVDLDLPASSTVLDMKQKGSYILFLINVYKSLENPVVRRNALRYLSLPIWSALGPVRLRGELEQNPQLKIHWDHLQQQQQQAAATAEDAEETDAERGGQEKKEGKGVGGRGAATKKRKISAVAAAVVPASTSSSASTAGAEMNVDGVWIPHLLSSFLVVLAGRGMDSRDKDRDMSSTAASEVRGAATDADTSSYVERFLELLIDLLSQLPTRRFLNTLIDDMHLIIRVKRALQTSQGIEQEAADAAARGGAMNSGTGRGASSSSPLCARLLEMLERYAHFEVMDQTGKAMTTQDTMTQSHGRIHRFSSSLHTSSF